MRRLGLSLLVALGLGACGGPARPPAPAVPFRAATVGDALLARLPRGADLVAELDLARLRANPTVGAAVAALVDGAVAPAGLPSGAEATGALLRGAAAVALAAYRVGTPAASTVTVVRGGARPAQALALGDDVWALADEGMTAAVLGAAGGPQVLDDRALALIRAAPMPAGADGAAIRVAARLDADGAAAVGAALGLAIRPRAIAAWLDVADDLAVVVWLDGVSPAAATALRDRLAALAPVRALGLGPAVAQAQISAHAGAVTATVVIGPRRLARAVARWQARAEAPP
ncbi:MAG: hypothetical protein R3B06_19650 [Kofleriaceae bacterium]